MKKYNHKLIRLPLTFVWDHNDRCDTGQPYSAVNIVKTAGNCAYAQVSDAGLFDLYNDALYYQHPMGPDACCPSISSSAKRTVKAIDRQMSEPFFKEYANGDWDTKYATQDKVEWLVKVELLVRATR